MASNINAQWPVAGNPTTQSVRDNFSAAKAEIEALQSTKENAGAANTAITAHVAATDPHPQYTTSAEAAAAAPVQSVAGKTGTVTLTKSDVGLTNVDNTSDANKPVSTATQTALDQKANLASPEFTGTPLAPTATTGTSTTQLATTEFVQAVNTAGTGIAASAAKLTTARTINGVAFDGTENITIGSVGETQGIPVSEKGVALGVATLDATGKVPSSQLPSYVDDVLEFINADSFPVIEGETGKIYVALDTNKTYRWSGSSYVEILSGAVDSVAGKTGVVTLVKGDVGLDNVDNTSDANKPVSTATQTALDQKANLVSPTFTGTVATSDLSTTGTLALVSAASPIVLNGAAGTSGQVLTSAGAGATPIWTKPNVITTLTTINVPADYPTIQAALASLSTLSLGAEVTIKVADGTYVVSSSILLNHPFGDRIRLIGNETNPDLCALIGPNPPTFNMLACTNGNEFGYLNGFKIDLPAKATLANNYSGIVALNGSVINCGPKIKVNNYYYGINASYGSMINADYAEVSNAGDVGIWAFCGSQVNARNAKSDNCSDIVNNWGFGFQAEYASNVDCEGATASGNYIAGFAALSNSQVRALNTSATSNGSGYKAQDNASIEAHNAVSNSNSLYGYFQQGSGRIFGSNLTGTGNGTALFNSIAYFDNSGSIGARVASSYGELRLDTNDKSSTYFNTQEGLQFEVSNTDAATSHFVVQGGSASTGNQPILRPSGTATDISSRYDSKGAAAHYFNTGGGLQFQVDHTSGAVNRLAVTGSATGAGPTIAAVGTDTNINLVLNPKGSGVVSSGPLNLRNASSPLLLNGVAGTTGQVLTSAGAGATPTWGSAVMTTGNQTVLGTKRFTAPILSRLDSTSEGGYIGFARASDDTTHYYWQANGTGTTPIMRLVNVARGVQTFSIDNAGNVTAEANLTAYSDQRLKTDLVKIGNALEKVRSLSGYTYTRIDSGDRQTGLLAQEVREVLPEAVMEQDNGILSLAYGNLAGLFVEAIKEQSLQIQTLQEELRILKGSK